MSSSPKEIEMDDMDYILDGLFRDFLGITNTNRSKKAIVDEFCEIVKDKLMHWDLGLKEDE